MGHLHQRLLMAVSVKQHSPLEKGRVIGLSSGFEELGKKQGLLAQAIRSRIGREQVANLVAEHRSATRLQHDNWYAVINHVTEVVQDRLQIALRPIEESEVIQGSPAAQRAARDSH